MHVTLRTLCTLAFFPYPIYSVTELGNVSKRYASLSDIANAAVFPINIDAIIAPVSVTNIVREAGLEWDMLPTATKIVVLWVNGYVFTQMNGSTSAYSQLAQIYTECKDGKIGMEMDDIAISLPDITAAECQVSQCSDHESYAGKSACSAKLYEKLHCAMHSVVPDQAQKSQVSQIANFPEATIWAQGNIKVSSMPYPQLYSHTSDSHLSLYSIRMRPLSEDIADTKAQCDSNQKDVVIPCASSPDAVPSKTFCLPKVNTVRLVSWIRMAASSDSAMQGSRESAMLSDLRSTKTSQMSSTKIFLLAVLVFLFLLAIASYYFLWYRPHRNAKKEQEKDFVRYNDEKHSHFQSKATCKSLQLSGNTVPMLGGSNDALLQDNSYGIKARSNDCLSEGNGSRSSYVFIASAPDTCIMMGDENYPDSDRANKPSVQKGTWASSLYPSNATQTSSACSDIESLEEYVQGSVELQQFISDSVILSHHIEYEELSFLRIVSKGAFGEVWLGQLEDRHVAIKSLLPERKHLKANLEEFAAEIRLMCNLQHPNILGLIHVSWNASFTNLCAITEYMENGDLDTVNQKSGKELRWETEKMRIAIDSAEGLLYLHSQQPIIVHRDIKSKNILVDTSWHAKLADFGISRKTAINETMTTGVGTLLWTAPEIIEGKKYSEKADIYSFGVVLGELDTGDRPFSHMKTEQGLPMPAMQMVQQVRLGNLKVELRDDCPPSLVELVKRCTALDPEARPSSMEVVFTLRSKIAPLLASIS